RDTGSVFTTWPDNPETGDPQPVSLDSIAHQNAYRQVPPSIGDRLFKTGARYRVGIQYVDHAGRSSGAIHPENCVVETDPDWSPFEPDRIEKIRWELTTQ